MKLVIPVINCIYGSQILVIYLSESNNQYKVRFLKIEKIDKRVLLRYHR